MCGVVGFTNPEHYPPEILSQMVETLSHRGPDSCGIYQNNQVALGHRRLSILDTSSNANQPMANENQSVIVAYNGECYNHQALRRLLPNVNWRSSGDTETILRLYEKEGHRFVRHLNGMFAIAVYDQKKNKIFLYRDRIGQKPLYYYHHGNQFVFASELKALMAFPDFPREICPAALSNFFLFNYIPAPDSIFQNTFKMEPGSCLEFDLKSNTLKKQSFWSLNQEQHQVTERNRTVRLEFAALLEDAVKKRTLSDVPIGTFLSGGIDSSAITAALATQSTTPIKTFCIGFEDPNYDETNHARQVARFLGTDHQEMMVGPKDLLGLVDHLPRICDEPFADASIIPTAVLCKWTRQQVTVALSGDGGDELFLGYDRYRWAEKINHWNNWFPFPGIRQSVASVMGLLPHYKMQTIGRGLCYPAAKHIYPYVFTGWNVPFVKQLLGNDVHFERNRVHHLSGGCEGKSIPEKAALTDLQHYLPDDILVKLDRASMAYSLEARSPFLDHRLVKFVLQLPKPFRENKRLLKRYLFERVPEKFFDRPKMGFAVPLKHWFRNELTELVGDLLSPKELSKHGLFDSRFIQNIIKKHHSGRYNYERQLWALISFQLWYREYMQ
jgi:asparagine synthase (glutamine-hydrolysing)